LTSKSKLEATVHLVQVEFISDRAARSRSAGAFTPNPQNAYSLNNVTAQRGADAKITIQFGGCDAVTANCLPITPGWNYLVRLYRPQDKVLNGDWTFPEAQPIS
jgi:hypothetical protein